MFVLYFVLIVLYRRPLLVLGGLVLLRVVILIALRIYELDRSGCHVSGI